MAEERVRPGRMAGGPGENQTGKGLSWQAEFCLTFCRVSASQRFTSKLIL